MIEIAWSDIPVFEKREKYSHNNSEIKDIVDWKPYFGFHFVNPLHTDCLLMIYETIF